MSEERKSRKWRPIEDLPKGLVQAQGPSVANAVAVWLDQAQALRKSAQYEEFLKRVRREWAIETGVLERLYSITEGATKTLIEQGLDASLLSHGDVDVPAERAIAMIRDQHAAIEGLYAFISDQRELSKSYIRELHQTLTANQEYCDAIDSLGRHVQTKLERGVWKTRDNNLMSEDGSFSFEFAPATQADPEMDRLLEMFEAHASLKAPPHVEAAWLHHRFTLIHPFQDGNGRVARCLASLVLLKAHWFPLVVTRRDKHPYLAALRAADDGDLQPLIDHFGELQRRAVRHAMSITEDVLARDQTMDRLLADLKGKFQQKTKAIKQQNARVLTMADAFFQVVSDVLGEAQAKLSATLPNEVGEVWVDKEKRGSERTRWYNFQTRKYANDFYGYFANFEHQSWVALKMKVLGVQTEVLFAFHGVGKDFSGLMVCAAMMYTKTPDQDGAPQIGPIVPLSGEPFEFNYRDDPHETQQRFERWVNRATLRAIEEWNRTV